MDDLLDVLSDGDPQLFKRAERIHARSMEMLGHVKHERILTMSPESLAGQWTGISGPRFRRMYMELFTARDIAESLYSFDISTPCEEVKKVMTQSRLNVVSIRSKGTVQGYLRHADLAGQTCTDGMRHFTLDQVITGDSTLSDVIHVLTRHDNCFVSMLGEVVGVISRDDINKPMVRMWLFGLITMIETRMVQMIQKKFPNDSWSSVITPERLQKAKQIQQERMRINQHCDLLDCLQLSDKARIAMENPTILESFGFATKRSGKQAIRNLESLRNNLAHAQDIVTHDWAQIARMSQRMEELSRR